MSAVVRLFLWFSSSRGVPLKPKNKALGKVSFIVISISPEDERWHSSTIKTMRLLCISSKSFVRIFNLASSLILLIFWIEVTISVFFGSVLFSLEISIIVSSVPWTSSLLSENAWYSVKDWSPSSTRSIRNTTLSASLEFAISWADLKEVMVFPEPVVCQIYPPNWFFSDQSCFATWSEILLAA